MQMHKVESTNIDSIGFENGVMHVQFKHGGLYEYRDQGVTEAGFQKLKCAKSVGQHLRGMNIKGARVPERKTR